MADFSTACRSVAELEKFISRVLPMEEVEDLARHVEECEHCAVTVDSLLDRDTLAETMRSQGHVAKETPSPLLPDLMDRLLTLRPCAGTGEDVSPDPLSFLAPPEEADEIGRLGPYRVLKVLGSGGMGVVLQAEDIHLKRLVALKVMRSALGTGSTARRRFLRETQAAASIKHDHVVTIHQVGEEAGLPFLAMELLEGESLHDYLGHQGRLPVAEVIRIGREMAHGLAAVHERGLVHRDIKPSNVWLEAHKSQSVGMGRVKILDFGIARPEQGEATLTEADQMVGTPAYISPEQARGERVDQRSDLFSLGCVLYHLCTGQLPFRGETSMARLTSLAVDLPEPVERIVPDLPAGLAQLIMRLLAKNPADRPPAAQAVVEALIAVERAPTGQVANLPSGAAGSKSAPRTSRRRLVVAVAAAILLLAGTWPVAQVIIRIRYPDGTEKDIPAPPGVKVRVIEDPGKGKGRPNPFDAFQRDRITTEELAKAVGGNAKDAPAELVGILDGGHTARVTALALHPDGKHLVSGDLDGAVCVWDVRTQKRVASFPGERDDGRYALRLSFSADGRRLAANVWPSGPAVFESGDASTLLNRPVRHFRDYDVTDLALSPDGKRFMAPNRAGTVAVWDVDSRQKLMTLSGHSDGIRCVEFSSDGARLATADGEGRVKVWDAQTGRDLRTLHGFGGLALYCVAFSRDGARVAAAGVGDRFKVWNTATGEEVVTCHAQLGEIFSALDFSPDGSRIAACRVGWLTVWSTQAAKVLHEWKMPGVRSVLFAPDGRHLLSGNDNGAIHVLRLHKRTVNPFDTFHRDQLTNEELAAAGGGDAKNAPAELVAILGDGRDNSPVMALALHPDGKHLVWGDEAGTVRVRDLFTRKEVAAFPGERSVDSLSFSSDGGRLATTVWKSGPAVFETAVAPMLLNRPVRHFKGYDPRNAALSPDGQALATGGLDKVTVLDVNSGKELMTLEHGQRIHHVAYSSDGAHLASAGADGAVNVWEARTGRNLHTLQGVGGALHSVVFSRDGTRLAAAGRGGEFKIWNAATGQEIVTCTCAGGPNTSVNALAFNADGSLVAAGDLGKRVTIWNSQSAQIVHDWKVQHRVWSVLFAPDGRHLLAGDQTGTVYVLRLRKS